MIRLALLKNLLSVAMLPTLPGVLLCGVGVQASEVTIDFEELPLAGNDHYDGCDGDDFQSQGVVFATDSFGSGSGCSWSGWAYSNSTDMPPPGSTTNQFSPYQHSVFPGLGANGSENFAVGYSAPDGGGGGIRPLVYLPELAEPVSLQVTNNTYAALSMTHGDPFAKKFGGVSGNDPDWFLLTLHGQDSASTTLATVTHYLADFRFAQSSEDYVQDDWQLLDLSPLAGLGVTQLEFRLTSSDVGSFGMNTPAYVAIDDLVLDLPAVEPNADFNNDQQIDQLDLTLLLNHFGAQSVVPDPLPVGDATADRRTDGADFLVWQRQFQPTATTLTSLPTVPEPSAAWLAGLALISFILSSPRRTNPQKDDTRCSAR